MRLPKTLTIYGLPYTVKTSANMAEVGAETEPCWGTADILTKQIAIFTGNGRVKVSPEQILNTLLHEIIHVVLRENTALAACLKDNTEEIFTDGLAVNLADTLTRNNLAGLK